MTRRQPESVVFGETRASDEDIREYGFVPNENDLKNIRSSRRRAKIVEDCTLAARLRFPDGNVDIVVDEDEMTKHGVGRPGDALRIRMGNAVSPNLNYYSAEALADMRDFLMVFFDIAIETATHRETQCDTLDTERKGAVPVEFRQTPTITYNDYMNARIKSNKKSTRGRRKTDNVTHYQVNRDEYETAMRDIAEQGADNDENTGRDDD